MMTDLVVAKNNMNTANVHICEDRAKLLSIQMFVSRNILISQQEVFTLTNPAGKLHYKTDTYFWNSHSLLSSGHTCLVFNQREIQWKWKACWENRKGSLQFESQQAHVHKDSESSQRALNILKVLSKDSYLRMIWEDFERNWAMRVQNLFSFILMTCGWLHR